MKILKKICIECGKEFETKFSKTLVCSIECRKNRDRQQERDRKNKFKKNGLCVTCGKPRWKNYAKCEKCFKRHKKKENNKKIERDKNGLCINCGKYKQENGIKYCKKCSKKTKEYAIKKKKDKKCRRCSKNLGDNYKYGECEECRNNNKKIYLNLIKNNICTRCKKQSDRQGKIYCSKCSEITEKQRLEKIKNNICPLCGNKNDRDRATCSSCAKKDIERKKNLLKNNTCPHCGKNKLEDGYKSCINCLLKRSECKTAEEFRNKSMRNSMPEKMIRRYIIEITNDKTIKKTANRSILPNKQELDIYSYNKNFAIEVDGIFHYKPIFGKIKLEKTKKLDKEKNELCKKLGIVLYRIDIYHKTVDEISNILIDIINKHYNICVEINLSEYIEKITGKKINMIWRCEKH